MNQGTLGPYELIARLGAGGMATVYRARDTRDGRFVALKLLHDYRSDELDYIRRFQQEARLATRLQHPNIVRVFEAGESGGTHYLAMELVEGETLQDRLQQRKRLPPLEVRRIAEAVALALEEAHAQKVIHRDVKPGNVLLGLDGSIKVADFGIARALDATSQTQTGTFLGSVAYASPETINGATDLRGDLYSLGILLYQALLGHVPFEGQAPAAVMRMHERDRPPDLDRLRAADADLAAIIERLLEKDPDDRYQSARHLLRALGASGGRRRWPPRRVLTAIGLIGAGGAAIAGAVTLGIVFAGNPGGDAGPQESPTAASVVEGTPSPTRTPSPTPNAVTRTAIAVTRTATSFKKTVVDPQLTALPLNQTSEAQTATVIAKTPTATAVPTAAPFVRIVSLVPSVNSTVQRGARVDVLVDYRSNRTVSLVIFTAYFRIGVSGGTTISRQQIKNVDEEDGRVDLFVVYDGVNTTAVFCGYEITVGTEAPVGEGCP